VSPLACRLLAPLVALLVAAGAAGLGAAPAAAYPGAPWFEPSTTYTENFPDPSVLVDGGTYYAYATATGGSYLPVMTSTDLRTWTARPRHPQPTCVRGAVDRWFNDALPCPARWAPDRPVGGRLTKGVWAPGVARIGSRIVVFYAVLARLVPERWCISVATSSSPLGPFVDDTSGPLVCDADPKGSIDPQPFVDADGTPFLLWKSEGVPGTQPTRIWARRLDASGTAFAAGSRATLLLQTARPWEGNVVENPTMVRHQGTLHLFYSANEWRSADYATGHAACASPLGPCTRSAGGPVLASRGDRLGPGGPTAFSDLHGRLVLGYHWWNAPHTSYPAHPECVRTTSCTSRGQRRLGLAQVTTSATGVRVGGTPVPRPAVRSITPACPGTVPRGRFPDVGANAHAAAVDCIAHWGLTQGSSDGHYHPAALVTRGQMAAFLARLLERSGQRLPSAPRSRFSDVAGTPHERAILQLAELGVVGGRADGTFGPLAPVDRGQMASFLVRTAETRTGRSLARARSWFPDDDGSTHERAIDAAASAGLAGGFTDGSYRPATRVRRDQMGSFLARTLALLVDEGHTRIP
jgi:hypothetical protein